MDAAMETEPMPSDDNALVIFNKDAQDVDNNNLNSAESSSYNISYNSTPSSSQEKNDEQLVRRVANDKIPPNHVLVKQLEPKHPNRLFFKILREKQIEDVVHHWLTHYRIDKDGACLQLYQLYVDLSAYQHIDVDYFLNVQKNDVNELVSHLESSRNTIMSYTGKYFLFIQNKTNKAKHARVEAFFEKFVEMCAKEKIVYDFDLFVKLMNFFIQMANSTKRNIKHTGVFIALKHQTGLITLGAKIVRKFFKIEKDLNAQLTPETEEELRNKIEKLKNYNEQIKKMILFLQLNVFKKNWNFYDPKLHFMRQECILELYKWIQIFPKRYLHNEYLNYILEAVTDPNKIVRYTAIEIIGKIIENYEPDIHSKLSKIISPISEQIKDVDYNVSILAVDTLTFIRRYTKIPSDIREILCKTIYHIHFPLAAACGRYLSEFIQQKNGDNGDKGLLLMLMSFEAKAMKRDFKNLHPYVIESIYDSFPVLQNINVFMQILNEGELDEMYLEIWINLLTETVHQTFTGKCSLKREKQRKRVIDENLVENMIKDFIRNLKIVTLYCKLQNITPLLILMKDHMKKNQTLEFARELSQT